MSGSAYVTLRDAANNTGRTPHGYAFQEAGRRLRNCTETVPDAAFAGGKTVEYDGAI